MTKKTPAILTGCEPAKKRKDPGKFSRKRAWVLTAVYLLMAGHFLHWKLAGKTMAPLEFNEATFASESGLITLGFIFMALALLSVIFFGRFFCGWACHILALQDLCSALLKKMKIKTTFISSRFLMYVPALVFFYMFLWTPFKRVVARVSPSAGGWLGATGEFALRVGEESTGYASFLTTDMWRNLPGPVLAVLTLLICGFAVVYLLGTRSFCAYVCPYGALFKWTDKLALGKITLTDNCHACGKCTSVCKSGVDVMTEVRTYGKVVDSNCFKDFDCIASCPEEALSFGFQKPSALTKKSEKIPPEKYSFSPGEEVGLVCITILVLLILLGLPSGMAPWAGRLYGMAPLLLSVTLAVITGFMLIYFFRIITRPEAHLHKWVFKKNKLLGPGWLFIILLLLWTGFLTHSAAVQYQMFRAGYILHQSTTATNPQQSLKADRHLKSAASLMPFFSDARVNRQRAWLALGRGDWALTESLLQKTVNENPDEPNSRFQLGWIMAGNGKTEAALQELHRVESIGNSPRYHNPVLKAWMQLVHRNLVRQAMDLLAAESLARPGDKEFHRSMLELLQKSVGDETMLYFLKNLLKKNPGHALADQTLKEMNPELNNK